MPTIYALSIPAKTNEEYSFIEAPLNHAKITELLGNNYRMIETNTPGVRFYEATSGNMNSRAAALCQLDDAAAGEFPKIRQPHGLVIITGNNGKGNNAAIPEEKLKAYSFYLDFAL